jgi:hypothetical protein
MPKNGVFTERRTFHAARLRATQSGFSRLPPTVPFAQGRFLLARVGRLSLLVAASLGQDGINDGAGTARTCAPARSQRQDRINDSGGPTLCRIATRWLRSRLASPAARALGRAAARVADATRAAAASLTHRNALTKES